MVMVDSEPVLAAALTAGQPRREANMQPAAALERADSPPCTSELPAPAARAPAAAELIESWFRTYYARLCRLVARLGTPQAAIDDVVQEAFVTAARRHADIREGREWPFLVGTAVRLRANHRVRAAARREVTSDEQLDRQASGWPDAEQLLIEKRLRQQLEQVLCSLSEDQRAVFVLYELEGFSVPEIAESLGLPLGTVASRLNRAREKFSETAARLQRVARARREEP